MPVKRLRPLPSPGELTAMYATPHDHRLYGRGHDERVEATIALALANLPEWERGYVADLSCGNGEIARRIAGRSTILGDLAPGYGITGPIEETVQRVGWVNVWVLSETLEHVDKPDEVLAEIRPRAGHLVLSTPIECWDDTNGEHLWAYDEEGVTSLLNEAGWMVTATDYVDSRTWGEPYWYFLAVCT